MLPHPLSHTQLHAIKSQVHNHNSSLYLWGINVYICEIWAVIIMMNWITEAVKDFAGTFRFFFIIICYQNIAMMQLFCSLPDQLRLLWVQQRYSALHFLHPKLWLEARWDWLCWWVITVQLVISILCSLSPKESSSNADCSTINDKCTACIDEDDDGTADKCTNCSAGFALKSDGSTCLCKYCIFLV